MLGPKILVPATSNDERIFMRLIDGDALFKMVGRSRNVNTHEKEEFRRAHEYEHSHFLHLITEQPTIDAVLVVHGEWKITRQVGFDILYCSACGEPLNCNDHGEYYKKKMRFCPFCGARMDGRRENGLYESLKRGLEEAIAYENGEIECRTETRKDGDM